MLEANSPPGRRKLSGAGVLERRQTNPSTVPPRRRQQPRQHSLTDALPVGLTHPSPPRLRHPEVSGTGMIVPDLTQITLLV